MVGLAGGRTGEGKRESMKPECKFGDARRWPEGGRGGGGGGGVGTG